MRLKGNCGRQASTRVEGQGLAGSEEELAPQRSGKSVLARGNCKCKGPEAGLAQ